MKTLLLSEIFPPRTGGSGRWFHELYARLPRAQFRIAAGAHPGAAAFDNASELDVQRLPLTLPAWGFASWRGLRGYARAFRALRRLVRREGIERLHCGRCLPEGWLAWMLKRASGIPYACFVHGEDVGTAATSWELSWMVRRVFRSADLLIANSKNTAQMLKRDWGRSEEQVQVLHPGVDTQRFRPAPRSSAIRQTLGWGERPVLLTVGRLQRRKGHDVLIRALAQVRRTSPDLLYVIVGAGEEEQHLRELIAAECLSGHVQFLGEADDQTLIDCYQQCDLFVLPNRTIGGDIEGFGMVLVEAQACGKPVIAGASGGTAETMHVPTTGRVVPCDTPEPLAAVITELLGRPEMLHSMGRAARAWTVEQFGWGSLVRQAERLFRVSSPGRRKPALAGATP